jgi:hypothetical protein
MSSLTVPTPPDITLEELGGDEIVVRISATPERPPDGAQLASEVLATIRQARRGADRERDAEAVAGAPASGSA